MWRAAFAGEGAEAALAADLAVGARGARGDLGALAGPEVVSEQRTPHAVGLAGEQLQCFGDLQRGGEVDGRGEDAGGVAGLDVAGRAGREEAGEAGGRLEGRIAVRRTREDVHRRGVGADGGGVDPGRPSRTQRSLMR